MTDKEIYDIIKLVAGALIGAFVALMTTFISNWQANRRLRMEIQEKQKDRLTRFTEKLSERIIESHVIIYQTLIHFKECIYFQNDYLTGDWFWGLEQPKDLVDINEMFRRLGDIIIANDIWLHPECLNQLKKLRWELQRDRETELHVGDRENEYAKTQLFPIYNRLLSEIDNSLKIVRTSIGVDSFDNLFRTNK
jgi:hypothetical protein